MILISEMNYIGTEPTMNHFKTDCFLFKNEFFLDSPSASQRMAMGDDHLCFRTKFSAYRNFRKSSPSSPAVGVASPCEERGLLLFPTQKVSELNHL
jgi:hypothetical protein